MINNDATYKNYFKSIPNNYNMNLVRCSPWIGNWEYMVKGDQWCDNHKKKIDHLIDKCVNWAEEANIYALINMHIAYGTKVDLQRVKTFGICTQISTKIKLMSCMS